MPGNGAPRPPGQGCSRPCLGPGPGPCWGEGPAQKRSAWGRLEADDRTAKVRHVPCPWLSERLGAGVHAVFVPESSFVVGASPTREQAIGREINDPLTLRRRCSKAIRKDRVHLDRRGYGCRIILIDAAREDPHRIHNPIGLSSRQQFLERVDSHVERKAPAVRGSARRNYFQGGVLLEHPSQHRSEHAVGTKDEDPYHPYQGPYQSPDRVPRYSLRYAASPWG